MDQKPLVEPQIDDGFKLARRLVEAGLELAAAFWVRTKEDGQWMLYLAVKALEEAGPTVAYRKVADALLQLEDPWISMSEITVVGAQHPIARDVLDMIRKRPGPMAIRSRRPLLGNLDIEEVYIYPPVEGTTRRLPPNVRIVGVKKIPRGSATEEEDEIGYVQGFIGEVEFNTKFGELIKSKFGSLEQFAVTYPRIILEEVDRS